MAGGSDHRYRPLRGRVPAFDQASPSHRPASPAAANPVELTEPAQRLPQGERARHCWVVNTPEAPGRWPGVLLGWERRPDGGWVGRVMMAASGREGMVTMTLWVRSEHLQPLADDGTGDR